MWLDDDMKWATNTEFIIKKAAKRLHFLRILKNYGACKDDLKSFYCTVIRWKPHPRPKQQHRKNSTGAQDYLPWKGLK